MTHKIASGSGQRRVSGILDLVIAFAQSLIADFRVNVARGAGHVARAHCLATRCFHRFIELARGFALWDIPRMGAAIMKFAVHGKRVCGAARDQHLLAGHAAGNLGQAHRVAGHTRRVDRVCDGQVGIIRHHLCGFRQGFLEGIGWVIVIARHFIHLPHDRSIVPCLSQG